MTFVPSNRYNIPENLENDPFAPYNSEDDFYLDDDGNPILDDQDEEEDDDDDSDYPLLTSTAILL